MRRSRYGHRIVGFAGRRPAFVVRAAQEVGIRAKGRRPSDIHQRSQHSGQQRLGISCQREKSTLQAIALAYLLSQSLYVVPIVGVHTVEHIKAMPEALMVESSRDDIAKIHKASPYNPGFPMSFLFNYRGT